MTIRRSLSLCILTVFLFTGCSPMATHRIDGAGSQGCEIHGDLLTLVENEKGISPQRLRIDDQAFTGQLLTKVRETVGKGTSIAAPERLMSNEVLYLEFANGDEYYFLARSFCRHPYRKWIESSDLRDLVGDLLRHVARSPHIRWSPKAIYSPYVSDGDREELTERILKKLTERRKTVAGPLPNHWFSNVGP